MILTSPSLHGQVGGLRGVVVDADFLQPLPNTAVLIEETSQRQTTDSDGTFFFNEMEPGVYTLLVSRDGYVRKRETDLLVSPGAVREAKVSLVSDVFELPEFVVTADNLIESDSQDPLAIRMELDNFADVVGEEFISQTGASDAGEALARVAGTSVVDSRYVVVRGLADRYNTVVLNSARIPSSDPDRRAVNVDIFPGGLIDSLANSKTFTPNIPGESTGGYINIATKSIPEKTFFKSKVKVGYNTQATFNDEFLSYRGPGTGLFGTMDERAIPGDLFAAKLEDLPANISATASPQVRVNRENATRSLNRITGTSVRRAPLDTSYGFELGTQFEMGGFPVGVIGAFTYDKSYNYDPNGELGREIVLVSPETVTPVETRRLDVIAGGESLLSGFLLSGGIELSPTDLVKATLFHNVAADEGALFAEGSLLGVGNSLVEALEYTERRLTTAQLAGEHEFSGGAAINWVTAYSESSQDQPDQRYATARYNPTTGQFRSVGADFSGEPFERIWRSLDDDNYFLSADIELPIFGSGTTEKEVTLDFGGSFDRSTREYRADNFAYQEQFLFFPAESFPNAVPDDRVGLTVADQLAPIDGVPFPNANSDFIYPFRNNIPEIYSADQNIVATYGSIAADVTENLDLGFGLRAELTDIRLSRDNLGDAISNITDPGLEAVLCRNPVTGELIPDDQKGKANINQWDGLPALWANWNFRENMRARVAFSRTVARPSFKELSPVFTRDPGSSTIFVGNPALILSKINNYDFRWEWLPDDDADLVAASFFSKSIDNPIEFVTLGSFDSFGNSKSGNLYGFELEVAKDLEFMGGAWNDVNILFNFTRLVSSVELIEGRSGSNPAQDRRVLGLPVSRRLQGQPDYIFNLSGTYDNENLGLFMGIFFNATGESLFATGGRFGTEFTTDVFARARTSLDLAFGKTLGDNWRMTIRAENLTNSPRLLEYASGGIYSRARSGIKYSVSFTGEW